MTRRRPPTDLEVRHALERARLALLLLGTARHSSSCERDQRHELLGIGLCASCQALDEVGQVLARLKDNDGRTSLVPAGHPARQARGRRVI